MKVIHAKTALVTILAALLVAVPLVFTPLAVSNVLAATDVTCPSNGVLTTCSITASPGNATQNTGFSLKASEDLTQMSRDGLSFIAVVTPDQTVYTCGPSSGPCPGVSGIGGNPSCTVPFAASGSLTSSDFSSGCSGSGSTAWVQQTGLNLSDLENDCTTNTGSFSTSPAGEGNSSQTGTYTALACWNTAPSTGYYVTTTFNVTSRITTSTTMSIPPPSTSSASSSSSSSSTSSTTTASGVPQFPLAGGIALLFVLVPLLLVLRKRMSSPESVAPI